MEELVLKGEFIKLGQLLKAVNIVESGAEAKVVINNGEVTVNSEIEYQRGKKLYNGDIVEFNSVQIKVISQKE